MTKFSFHQNCFLISFSINPDTLVKVSVKAKQKVKFNSELNSRSSCQISNAARTVVFFATNTIEDPIAVFGESITLNNSTVC